MTVKLIILNKVFKLENSINNGCVRIGTSDLVLIRIGNDGVENIKVGDDLEIIGMDNYE